MHIGAAALTRLGCGVFFLLNPLLEATFKNTPLAADFECGDLPVLDHAVQSSLGYFQYTRRLGKG